MKGAHVIKQGEVGASFFVIASGDVNVEIDGKFIRPKGCRMKGGGPGVQI